MKSKIIAFSKSELLKATSNYFLLLLLIFSSYSAVVIKGITPFRGVLRLCVTLEIIYSLN